VLGVIEIDELERQANSLIYRNALMNKLNPENRDVILPQRQNQDNYYLE
jgi:hypothetical protein